MRNERGFSLIELLMAMVIMMIVLGVTMRAFMDALKVDDAIKLTTEVDQNLQSASMFLTRDLIDTARGWPPSLPLPKDGANPSIVVRPGPAKAAAAGYPGGGTELYPVMPGDGLGPKVGTIDTDTVTICYMDGLLDKMNLAGPVTLAGTTAKAQLAAATNVNTNPERTIQKGDLFYVFNGNSRAVQRATDFDPATKTLTFDKDTDTMKINQPGLSAGSINPLVGLNGTQVYRLMMVTYYIDVQGGVTYLMRQSNIQPAQQIAIGVRNLQLAYNVVIPGPPIATVRTSMPYPLYSFTQLDQAFVSIEARSDKPLRESKMYLSNDVATQVSFRSLSAKTQYSVK
jgi:prepilin-type N-terminal cleavage/methylation domain-containing protein